MLFHPATLLAFFTDHATQASMVAQCPQAAPETWVKWLLPTIVQTVVGLLSIVAGVTIAVWSFRRNRQTEHEQWVRDQELEEWRELISAVASVEDLIPIWIDERLDLDALTHFIHEGAGSGFWIDEIAWKRVIAG
jgi:heme/copper-type cytochrome/quinol oxidase subunit 2